VLLQSKDLEVLISLVSWGKRRTRPNTHHPQASARSSPTLRCTDMADTQRLTTTWEGKVMVVKLLSEKITDFDIQPLETDFKVVGPTCLWKMAVDMSSVQLVGSSGLAFLIWLKKQCAAGGGKVVYFGFSNEIMGMLKVTKLNSMFTIAADRKAAIAAAA
jgi:ABC-type transporter Mla MlaB component